MGLNIAGQDFVVNPDMRFDLKKFLQVFDTKRKILSNSV